MVITVESTTKMVTLNGVECRVWEGQTAGGIELHCFIARVGVKEDLPAAAYVEFERDLAEQKKPSAEVEAIPLRMIL